MFNIYKIKKLQKEIEEIKCLFVKTYDTGKICFKENCYPVIVKGYVGKAPLYYQKQEITEYFENKPNYTYKDKTALFGCKYYDTSTNEVLEPNII